MNSEVTGNFMFLGEMVGASGKTPKARVNV